MEQTKLFLFHAIVSKGTCATLAGSFVALCLGLDYALNMPIKMSESKELIRDFLGKSSVGVLATCDKSGQPHAAAVYIINDEELNVYFITKEGTQKSQDIRDNPKVALAVYDEASQTTLQTVGSVSNVEDTAEANKVFS